MVAHTVSLRMLIRVHLVTMGRPATSSTRLRLSGQYWDHGQVQLLVSTLHHQIVNLIRVNDTLLRK